MKLDKDHFVHAITSEQIEEFAHMTPGQRLQWLEEANAFINRTIGLERRAQWDSRFEVFLKNKKKRS